MAMTWIERGRHQMEIISTLLALCAGNSPVIGEFPAQRSVMWSFDVFFDLHLNKRLSKQASGWWFEMLSHSLWLHCNVDICHKICIQFDCTSFCCDILSAWSDSWHWFIHILQGYFTGIEAIVWLPPCQKNKGRIYRKHIGKICLYLPITKKNPHGTRSNLEGYG